MGISNLPTICEKLIEHGSSPETPVILIQWGTYSRQKTLEGTLSTIADLASEKNSKIQRSHSLGISFPYGGK